MPASILAYRVAARIKVAREFPSEKSLKDYLREHPQADRANHTVSEGKQDKKPDPKPSLKERLKAALKSVPKKAQRFCSDEEYRKESLASCAKAIEKGHTTLAKNALKHIQKEHESFKVAGQGIKAALSGKELSKDQKAAVKSVARDIAITVAVTALGGVGGVAGLAHKSALSFLTGLAKKIAINAVGHDFIEDIGSHLTNLETAHGAASAVFHLVTKLGKESEELDPHEVLAQVVTARVMLALKDLSDEDLVTAIEKQAKKD